MYFINLSLLKLHKSLLLEGRSFTCANNKRARMGSYLNKKVKLLLQKKEIRKHLFMDEFLSKKKLLKDTELLSNFVDVCANFDNFVPKSQIIFHNVF